MHIAFSHDGSGHAVIMGFYPTRDLAFARLKDTFVDEMIDEENIEQIRQAMNLSELRIALGLGPLPNLDPFSEASHGCSVQIIAIPANGLDTMIEISSPFPG